MRLTAFKKVIQITIMEHFEEFHHVEYSTLKLYPEAGILEREAGLLSELVEMFSGNCTLELRGASQFLIDNLPVCSGSGPTITYLNGTGNFVLTLENKTLDSIYKYKIYITNIEKVLYCDETHHNLFLEHFKYYFEGTDFKFDNLICLCMIVKDAGPGFEKVLTDNLPNFDKWCILDTGSTDGTQDVIKKVLANKRGNLYEEPFINFRDSRNRCLELAGTSCKFLLTLDDTYVIEGNLKSFLTEVRGDQYSDSFSLLIKSGDSEYYSNRIIKSKTNLRYIYTIHEIINDKNNINVAVPVDRAIINDYKSGYMEDRTSNRKKFDLDLLFKEVEDFPDDPRALYYIAQTCTDEVKKAEYFEKRIAHPVQGYLQEKIDSLFELARCYNFKLGRSWEECETLYLQAWELDKKRPDSLYFIGYHWYLEKNFLKAYEYFKSAFQTGYPIDSQYSLKPTLSFHFVPKFLVEVCYYQKDFQLGHQACDFFLKNNKINCDSWNMMISWMSIYNQLIKMPPRNPNPIMCQSKIVIVTDGGWNKWTGRDILTKGLGGSETWVIEMARKIVNVIVFCNCECQETFEGSTYAPIEYFHEFINNYEIDYCIISRFTEYVPVALEGNCKNVAIVFHDLIPSETVIPIHPKLKWIFCLTDWHTEYTKQIFPQFPVYTLNYGIDKKFSAQKIPHSFIYSSFPTRGLVILLRMWPRILEKFSDATLHVYCDLEHEWSNRVEPDDMKEIKCTILQKGVTNHGWVSKNDLNRAWETTEYWLYPCIFQETFCMTALEAAASKTFVVTNNLAALRDTVGNRGLVVHGDPRTIEWQNQVIEQLGTINENLVEENYKWAQSLAWDNQSQKLMKYLYTPLDGL